MRVALTVLLLTLACAEGPRPPAAVAPPPGTCRATGCSRQLCAEEELASSCTWSDTYACYEKAACERQRDGRCGWTMTPALAQCLGRVRN
jgi:hypothetical protein